MTHLNITEVEYPMHFGGRDGLQSIPIQEITVFCCGFCSLENLTNSHWWWWWDTLFFHDSQNPKIRIFSGYAFLIQRRRKPRLAVNRVNPCIIGRRDVIAMELLVYFLLRETFVYFHSVLFISFLIQISWDQSAMETTRLSDTWGKEKVAVNPCNV